MDILRGEEGAVILPTIHDQADYTPKGKSNNSVE